MSKNKNSECMHTLTRETQPWHRERNPHFQIVSGTLFFGNFVHGIMYGRNGSWATWGLMDRVHIPIFIPFASAVLIINAVIQSTSVLLVGAFDNAVGTVLTRAVGTPLGILIVNCQKEN
jgi:hypothetical protein